MQSSTMINRQHGINSEYFDNINTQEKAYWLGFIWADGNITKTTPRASGPNRLRIAQKWQEREHLESLKTELNADYNIKPISHDNGCVVGQLDINCRELCKALQNMGYDVKNKRIHLPNIPTNLMQHFIRGYFDGDGALSLYTQTVKQWTIRKQELSITGNIHLMTEIKNVLNNSANVTPTVKLKYYKRSPDTASIRYGKISDILCIYNYLYKDATVYLTSKHQKFVDFLRLRGLQSNALRIPCK